jgi:hypothetical protein
MIHCKTVSSLLVIYSNDVVSVSKARFVTTRAISMKLGVSEWRSGKIDVRN